MQGHSRLEPPVVWLEVLSFRGPETVLSPSVMKNPYFSTPRKVSGFSVRHAFDMRTAIYTRYVPQLGAVLSVKFEGGSGEENLLGGAGGRLLVLKLTPEVAVNVPGRLDAGMARPGLNLFRRGAVPDPQRDARMPQTVHTKGRRLAFLDDAGCSQKRQPKSVVVVIPAA